MTGTLPTGTREPSAKVERALSEMKIAAPICAFNNVRIFSRSLERLYDEAFRPAGLTASQVALMWTIMSTEPVLLKDLPRFLSCDQTTLSRIVSRAHDLDLIEIERDPDDQRLKIVRLSASGRQRLAGVLPQWKRAQASVESLIDLSILRKLAGKARRGLAAQA